MAENMVKETAGSRITAKMKLFLTIVMAALQLVLGSLPSMAAGRAVSAAEEANRTALLLSTQQAVIQGVREGDDTGFHLEAENTGSKKKKKKDTSSQNNQGKNQQNIDLEGSIFDQINVNEEDYYTSKEEVAVYIHQFGHLPDNFITKKEAKALGWVSSEGNLDDVAPGKSIGGDYFGNYEELLPVKKGRSYYECDIDFDGRYRGAKRIIFSNDGLIFYTEDHYESFEQLWPVE